MNKKQRAVHYTKNHLHILQCPICHTRFSIVDNKSLVCSNHHAFDFAKQGYINVLTHSVKSNYNKHLFKARQQIIHESGLYDIVHEKLIERIKAYTSHFPTLSIADLGCGDGSHLNHIISGLQTDSINIGIDISKEGIIAATKNNIDAMWFVGDLANIPLQSNSVDVLLNILSPANYGEFKRIAKNNGLCIKLVPRKNYLRELREFIQKPMENTVAPKELFKKQVRFQETITVQYTKTLNQEELLALCEMTPLMWNIEKQKTEEFIQVSNGEVTIDVDILIGKIIN